MEDEHAALSTPGEKRADHGLQVRRIRRGILVRPVAQEAAGAISETRDNDDAKPNSIDRNGCGSLHRNLCSGSGTQTRSQTVFPTAHTGRTSRSPGYV